MTANLLVCVLSVFFTCIFVVFYNVISKLCKCIIISFIPFCLFVFVWPRLQNADILGSKTEPHHSRHPSHTKDNARSLNCCTTRELPDLKKIKQAFLYQEKRCSKSNHHFIVWQSQCLPVSAFPGPPSTHPGLHWPFSCLNIRCWGQSPLGSPKPLLECRAGLV